MGYGDTSGSGHAAIQTPALDRMAREGQRWPHFYVAASVCSPSRAGLLTGRLPIRSGLASSKHRVFFPWSKGGIPQSEFTLAELFKRKGYKTAMVGKWHLGHLPEFLPTRHGFERWFGIPYSNDMDKTDAAKALLRRRAGAPPAPAWYEPRSEWFQIPLMRDEAVLERGPDQTQLTARYKAEALEFIRQNRAEPFFLYLAFSMPHVPLFRSPDFVGRSAAGLYGDVIEEMDVAVGAILDELRALHLDRRTLVVFTSDNGPWLQYRALGGSTGPFRGGKSTAWEGGFRVPAIFWGPGQVSPGTVEEMGSTLDFMRTFASMTDSNLPEVALDSFDLSPALSRHAASGRDKMFFYLGNQLAAVRSGVFKAHYLVPATNSRTPISLERPLLYNLVEDPSEQFDLARSKPEVLAALARVRDEHLASIRPVEDQLIRR
jgi:arylsulfatase A-like enzyme